MLTRNGYVTENSKEKRNELTVRAEMSDYVTPPAFKVFRLRTDKMLVVPRYYGGSVTKDVRVACAPTPNIVFTGTLREATRQPEAFARGTGAFASKGGGVLSLPCGFGKTTVALALSAHLKVRTMVVVHKEFLGNQWIDKIKEFCPGASIGRVQGDVFDIEKDFVIALIQTLSQREFPLNALDSVGLLIVDEAHHIGAPAFSQFMFKMCPKYTLGLTATPERKDGLTRLLYWFLGPEFFRIERTEQKTTKVETIHYDDPAYKESPPVTRFGKINMAGMISKVTELSERNKLIVRTVRGALKESRKVLVLSDRREHCFELQRLVGDSAKLYIGGMKESDLEESAKSSVVVATFQLAHEGLDIPTLDTVILATPKSDIKQSIGRIMRETPGKKNAPLIYDIADHWSVFFSMYRKRCAVYREGGFEMDQADEPPSTTTQGCLFFPS